MRAAPSSPSQHARSGQGIRDQLASGVASARVTPELTTAGGRHHSKPFTSRQQAYAVGHKESKCREQQGNQPEGNSCTSLSCRISLPPIATMRAGPLQNSSRFPAGRTIEQDSPHTALVSIGASDREVPDLTPMLLLSVTPGLDSVNGPITQRILWRPRIFESGVGIRNLFPRP